MCSTSEEAGGLLYILQAYPATIIALDIETGHASTVFSVPDGTPDGIQVDFAGNVIYWTSMGKMPEIGEAFLDADGTIECCNLRGGDHHVLIGGGNIVTPKQIQLDLDGGLLYWCDREGMAIFSSRVDGSALKMLYQTGEWPADSEDALRHCVGIALDIKNRHIYWTQKGTPDGGKGRILRMGMDLLTGQLPSSRQDVELLMDLLPEPIDLEIDHANQQIYWTDRGLSEEGGNSLNRADIVGGSLINHKILATGLKEAIGLALDLKRRRAFVSDLSGAIQSVSMDGGTLVTVYVCSGPVTGIAFAHH
ncbi:hypothetical protein [Pseudomonas sp. 17104299]|uniref:hypothetical protein n=1 Tax=Pseudomonas sp. 17104299 TaxID=2952239 RepID=UPI002157C4B5|nr:hypothetical protein [Pseudomonas sp. 17104299]